MDHVNLGEICGAEDLADMLRHFIVFDEDHHVEGDREVIGGTRLVSEVALVEPFTASGNLQPCWVPSGGDLPVFVTFFKDGVDIEFQAVLTKWLKWTDTEKIGHYLVEERP